MAKDSASVRTFMVERDEGMPLGITLNENMIVTALRPFSILEGKVEVGDKVIAIQGRAVPTWSEYHQKLRFAHPMLEITIRRESEEKTDPPSSQKDPPSNQKNPPSLQRSAPQTSPGVLPVRTGASPDSSRTAPPPTPPPVVPKGEVTGIPKEMDAFLRRRAGCEYFVFQADFGNGPRGQALTMQNSLNRVIVTAVKVGSLEAMGIRAWDRILMVDSCPVSDKTVANHLLVGKPSVQIVVERPISPEVIRDHQQAAAPKPPAPAPSRVPRQGEFPPDVEEIASREQERRKREGTAAPPSALKKPGTISPGSKTIYYPKTEREAQRVTQIASDVSPDKNLRAVPRNK